jgi:hypothetical protein
MLAGEVVHTLLGVARKVGVGKAARGARSGLGKGRRREGRVQRRWHKHRRAKVRQAKQRRGRPVRRHQRRRRRRRRRHLRQQRRERRTGCVHCVRCGRWVRGHDAIDARRRVAAGDGTCVFSSCACLVIRWACHCTEEGGGAERARLA